MFMCKCVNAQVGFLWEWIVLQEAVFIQHNTVTAAATADRKRQKTFYIHVVNVTERVWSLQLLSHHQMLLFFSVLSAVFTSWLFSGVFNLLSLSSEMLDSGQGQIYLVIKSVVESSVYSCAVPHLLCSTAFCKWIIFKKKKSQHATVSSPHVWQFENSLWTHLEQLRDNKSFLIFHLISLKNM